MSWLAALNALMVLAVGVRILLRRHRTPIRAPHGC